jgi:acylaminoacyl-peptidase
VKSPLINQTTHTITINKQGLEYFHALKAQNVPTKLLIYEQDVHAIDRPVSEADHWLQIGRWLEEHL